MPNPNETCALWQNCVQTLMTTAPIVTILTALLGMTVGMLGARLLIRYIDRATLEDMDYTDPDLYPDPFTPFPEADPDLWEQVAKYEQEYCPCCGQPV